MNMQLLWSRIQGKKRKLTVHIAGQKLATGVIEKETGVRVCNPSAFSKQGPQHVSTGNTEGRDLLKRAHPLILTYITHRITSKGVEAMDGGVMVQGRARSFQ